MASDLLSGGQSIAGSAGATSTASLVAGGTGVRGYVLAVGLQVATGTVTLCDVELRDNATAKYAVSFPVPAVATSTGGQILFPAFIPITTANTQLNIVARFTGGTGTVFAIVSYGP